MSQLKIRGTLTAIGQEEQITDSFKKRQFLIKTDHEQYPQEIKFDLVQSKTNLIDTFSQGQDVDVYFNIRGNRSKDGSKVFNNLQAWKIEEFTPSIPNATQSEPAALQNDLAGIPRQSDDFKDLPF